VQIRAIRKDIAKYDQDTDQIRTKYLQLHTKYVQFFWGQKKYVFIFDVRSANICTYLVRILYVYFVSILKYTYIYELDRICLYMYVYNRILLYLVYADHASTVNVPICMYRHYMYVLYVSVRICMYYTYLYVLTYLLVLSVLVCIYRI
jgi:hypothetical protein